MTETSAWAYKFLGKEQAWGGTPLIPALRCICEFEVSQFTKQVPARAVTQRSPVSTNRKMKKPKTDSKRKKMIKIDLNIEIEGTILTL